MKERIKTFCFLAAGSLVFGGIFNSDMKCNHFLSNQNKSLDRRKKTKKKNQPLDIIEMFQMAEYP